MGLWGQKMTMALIPSPGSFQSRHRSVSETGDDGEHGVEVVGLLALARHLDELLDDLDSPGDTRLRDDLGDDPHHLAVDQLAEPGTIQDDLQP